MWTFDVERLTEGNELSLRKKSTSDWPKSPQLQSGKRWSHRAHVRSVICLYWSYERWIDCTLQPRLVPCWNLCYRDWPICVRVSGEVQSQARALARVRNHNSKCVPRHVAGPQVCSPNDRREIVSSTYTHTRKYTHMCTRTRALTRWMQTVGIWGFVNVEWI